MGRAGYNNSGKRVIPGKWRMILSMVGRDMRQIRRHGLLLIISLSIIILIIGMVFFNMAGDQFEKSGIPTWTGDILLSGEDEIHVEISADRLQGMAPLSISFTSRVEGISPPLEYQWNFDDGDHSDEANVTHAYASPGEYSCGLILIDSHGESYESNNLRIIVREIGDHQLRVRISANRTEGRSPLHVAFYSAVSGGKGPFKYSWDLGDGNTSQERNPIHGYEKDDEYNVSLTVTDSNGNVTTSDNLTLKAGEESFDVPFALLDIVYGYCIVLCLILVPTIFATAYNPEMKKGTVRTLVCYPIGVLEINIAKLLYTYIMGFIICGAVFFITTSGLGKPFGERFLVFLVALTFTWLTVGIGSFISNMMTYVRKKFILRPTAVPWFVVIFSLIFTRMIFFLIIMLVKSLSGGGFEPDNVIKSVGPLIAISPYHQGGELLSRMLGGGGSVNIFIYLVPIGLVMVGVMITRRLYPDIYEKE